MDAGRTERRVVVGREGDAFEVPVTLSVFGASPARGVATVQCRTFASRVRRAALALGAAWLLAFPAIFFPVVHFVLVPGLVVGGVVMSVMFLREDRTLARIRATCPRCEATLDLAPGGRFRLPRPVQCVHCKNELTLAAVDTPEGQGTAE
jgi:hypothetical protein